MIDVEFKMFRPSTQSYLKIVCQTTTNDPECLDRAGRTVCRHDYPGWVFLNYKVLEND